jgi:DNA-directed RNA polymerase specialized sigma24 family protein
METEITEFDGQSMQEDSTNRAARLYRIAFLLTGDRARSVEVTLEAIDFDDGTNSFFSSWLLAWSQRLVIAKALAGIRQELTESARRTASVRIEKIAFPSRNPVLDADADLTEGQFQSALLEIDLFPRCALVLTTFEGMSEEDAAILLNGDRGLVRKARIVGLQELTRNLARMRGWTYTASRSWCRPETYTMPEKEERNPNPLTSGKKAASGLGGMRCGLMHNG